MIEYLQKYGGYNLNGLTIQEKKELEHLRVELKKYREIEEQENKEVVLSEGSDSDSENKSKSDSLKNSKKESLEEIELNDKENENDNENNNENDNEKNNDENKSESESEDDEDSQLGDLSKNPVKPKKIAPRTGVSAEAYGQFNKKEDFVARTIPKTDEQIQRIKSSVIHSFLFNNLEAKDLQIVIGAMEEKRFKSGDYVITQGDRGDCLYFVESGNLECYKQFSKGTEPVMVKKYQPGDSFGELALLYNAPRAASIKAVSEEVITWVLDRETFNNIVKDAAQKKREKYENFLKKVEILSTIDPYELMQICDAIKSATYQKDDYIIREGEMGDIFYILEEGECIATKTLEPGKADTMIKEYRVGDYFGERALIKGEPRFANIIVKSETAKVISLDRTSFKRLLGPIEDLLKRNIEKYQTFIINNQ